MKALVLQHFEEYWSEGLSKYNTNFEEVNEKVMDFIVSNKDLDKIIITRFEGYEAGEEHFLLLDLCEKLNIKVEFQTYAYAWFRDEEDQYPKNEENITWCQGTRDHHGEDDVIEITDWMHDLKNNYEKVFVGGAFKNECHLDLVTALSAIDINYEDVDGLVVGDFIDYEFKNTPYSELSYLENIIDELNEELENIETDIDNPDNEDLSELIEIEDRFNNEILPKLPCAKNFKLEFNYVHDKLQEMMDYSLEKKEDYKEYSDILDKINLENIKDKLNKNESKQKRKLKMSPN